MMKGGPVSSYSNRSVDLAGVNPIAEEQAGNLHAAAQIGSYGDGCNAELEDSVLGEGSETGNTDALLLCAFSK